jgi:hypothetical protein
VRFTGLSLLGEHLLSRRDTQLFLACFGALEEAVAKAAQVVGGLAVVEVLPSRSRSMRLP